MRGGELRASQRRLQKQDEWKFQSRVRGRPADDTGVVSRLLWQICHPAPTQRQRSRVAGATEKGASKGTNSSDFTFFNGVLQGNGGRRVVLYQLLKKSPLNTPRYWPRLLIFGQQICLHRIKTKHLHEQTANWIHCEYYCLISSLKHHARVDTQRLNKSLNAAHPSGKPFSHQRTWVTSYKSIKALSWGHTTTVEELCTTFSNVTLFIQRYFSHRRLP